MPDADAPPPTPAPDGAPPRFEAAVQELEDLIEQIESGEIGLEAALRQYEQGTRLIRHCRGILDRAERRIAELTVTPAGGLDGGKPADPRQNAGETQDQDTDHDDDGEGDEDVPF